MSAPALTPDLIADSVRPQFSKVLSMAGGRIYLANHSLGRPPDATATNLARFASEWTSHMDDCWSGDLWAAELDKYRAQVARLVGATSGDGIVPKTSAGQGLRAVLNAFPQDRPVQVVSTTGEFDSIDFILKTYGHLGRARVTWCEPSRANGEVALFEASTLIGAITEDTDLVVVSAVFFTTGQVMEGLEDIVRAAHEHGAMVLIDAYHAIGVVPFDMTSLGADFAIGGCYKYLRGGPGACYLAIHPRNFDRPDFRTLDTGWFAKKDKFSYSRPDTPELAPEGEAWMESTPSVVSAYQANPGLSFTLETGVENLRRHNLSLQSLLRESLLRESLPVFVPDDPDQFGAFVLLPHADSNAFAKRLKDRGVTVDARNGLVRFGPDVLNTSEEVIEACSIAAKSWA